MVTYKEFGNRLALTNTLLREHLAQEGWLRPNAALLAAEFSKLLRDLLGEQTMREVVKINRTADPQTCASGDYCDSNMVMLQAWENLTGTRENKIHIHHQTVMDRINEAWDIAKLFDFRLEFEAAHNHEGEEVPAFGFDHRGMFIANATVGIGGFPPVAPGYYKLSREAVDALTRFNAGRDLI